MIIVTTNMKKFSNLQWKPLDDDLSLSLNHSSCLQSVSDSIDHLTAVL